MKKSKHVFELQVISMVECGMRMKSTLADATENALHFLRKENAHGSWMNLAEFHPWKYWKKKGRLKPFSEKIGLMFSHVQFQL